MEQHNRVSTVSFLASDACETTEKKLYMFSVVKPDGVREAVSEKRLRQTIGWACIGYESFVDVELILSETLKNVFDGITPQGIADALMLATVTFIERDPAYGKVAVRLQLKKLFQTRAIQKVYRAIVCRHPKNREGVINLPIGRNVRNPTKRAINRGHDEASALRDALTEYRVLQFGEKFSLVEFHPKTGRMHQLRIHAASLGTPIACDKKYGGARVCCPAGVSRQLLHAESISFSLSPGHAQSFSADPPEDFSLAMQMVV